MVVQGITGLKTYIVKGEQDLLNPVGVNAIRRFDTLGTRVWGARTLSSDSSLIYVNVRRTLIYLEASIDQGTQWVVFEPNTPDTWDRLTDSVTAFLTTQWSNGALFGAAVRRVLRALRRDHDDRRRHPERPADLPDWRRHRAAGRVRHLPHRADHRLREPVEADMATERPNKNPYSAFNFTVTINGAVIAAFQEVSGLDSENTPIEYREGGDAFNTLRKLPGIEKYPNLTRKRAPGPEPCCCGSGDRRCAMVAPRSRPCATSSSSCKTSSTGRSINGR